MHTRCFIGLVALLLLGAQGMLMAQTNPPPRRGTNLLRSRPAPAPFKPDLSVYEKKVWISSKGDTLRYRLLLPENYDASKRYPLVLFLHGAGERGSDNEKQLTHGAALFLKPENRSQFPAIVVFPQCDSADFWANVVVTTNDTTGKRAWDFPLNAAPNPSMQRVMDWLAHLQQSYPVDMDRRYVMGLSMGGMGTFELVRRMPGQFAAAIPICGGSNPQAAAAIRHTAFWIFHGQKDDVVPYALSEAMVLALSNIADKEEVNFTMYPEANHNSWDKAFAEPELLVWLFGQVRKPR